MDSGEKRKRQQVYDKVNRDKTLGTTRKHGNTGKNDGVHQITDW